MSKHYIIPTLTTKQPTPQGTHTMSIDYGSTQPHPRPSKRELEEEQTAIQAHFHQEQLEQQRRYDTTHVTITRDRLISFAVDQMVFNYLLNANAIPHDQLQSALSKMDEKIKKLDTITPAALVELCEELFND